jgi:DNA adenine methylase
VKIYVPPIKSQGIKTKLVPWISSVIPKKFKGCWIEPFMGTGVVAFNVAPIKAIMSDINPHLINFYQAIQNGSITSSIVREFLNEEGAQLLKIGEDHYYHIRDRFNKAHDPLDFLFINRAGFNGMIRFNRKGGFNIPFCRKPNRFAQAYVTKIVNQVDYISRLFKAKDFTFKCQSFEQAISSAGRNDLIYCDPPYIGRHVDYFNGWDSESEHDLFRCLSETSAKFILSTWHHNDYRKNDYIESLWGKYSVQTHEHFYHVGGSEDNRNPVIEAIITNYKIEAKLLTHEAAQLEFID